MDGVDVCVAEAKGQSSCSFYLWGDRRLDAYICDCKDDAGCARFTSELSSCDRVGSDIVRTPYFSPFCVYI